MAPAVFLDLSQLVHDPARTGIQRAERELIRHWPGPAPLVPCWFDRARGGFRVVVPDLFDGACVLVLRASASIPVGPAPLLPVHPFRY